MDTSNSADLSTRNLDNDKNYYKVPTNLYEFIPTVSDGRRVLNVNEPDLLQYRKYRPDENDKKYFCSGCYFKHGLKNYAYFLDGSLFAPILHSCEFIATSKKDSAIKNVKVEANDGNNVAASTGNSASTSEASTSGVITFLDPFLIFSSTNLEINQRPPPSEDDIIFLDDDEINPEYEEETPSTTNDKLESEFRSVVPELYERAYSAKGNKETRLIVFEGPEKDLIRQYAGNQYNSWFCMGCHKKSKKFIRAFFKDEIFVAPKIHFCHPFSYEEAKKEQDKIIQKWNINENELADDADDNSEGSNGEEQKSPDREENSIRSRLRSRTPTTPICSDASSANEIPVERYIFGVGASNQKNGRIFVFDDVDKNYGYEYTKSKNSSYYCRSCFLLDKTEKKRWLIVRQNGLRLPKCQHICKRVLYSDVQKEQERIKEKYGPFGSKNVRRRKPIQGRKKSDATSIVATDGATPAAVDIIPGSSRQRAQTPIDSFDAFCSQTPDQILSGEKDSSSSSPQNACRPPRNQNPQKFAASGPSRKRSQTPAYQNSPSAVAADIPGSSRTPIYARLRSPPPSSPIYSDAQIRRRSTPDALFLPARTPDSPVSSSLKTPIYSRSAATSPLPSSPIYSDAQIRRRRTPDAPIIQFGIKRKGGRQRKNVDSGVVKRAKSAKIDHNLDESIEESEEDDIRLQRIKATENFVLNNTNICSSNVDKNVSQKLANPLIPTSSNVSTPVNQHPSSSKQRILYSSKIATQSSFTLSHRTSTPTNSAMTDLFKMILSTKTSTSNPPTTVKPSAPSSPSSSNPPMNVKPPTFILTTPSTTPISSSSTNIPPFVIPSTPVLSTPSTTPLSSSTPIQFGLSDHTSTVKWYRPSSFTLEKCCEKLDLVYSDEAYNVWMNIKIDKISPISIPDNVFATNEEIYFGWECISLFFTGSEDKAFFIREKINEHIYRENSKSLYPVNRETEEKVIFSKSITEVHLESISSMFECRIGIFADNKWMKYGNWSTLNSDILTLLMEKKDEKYFLVLSLK